MKWMSWIKDFMLMQNGPQILPYSRDLLFALILLDALISVAAGYYLAPQSSSWPRFLLIFALQFGLPSLALMWAGHSARLVKTLSAIALIDLAFTLLVIPVVMALLSMPVVPEVKPTMLQLFVNLAWLGLQVWQVMANGNVYRHVFAFPLPLGIGLALLFFVISATTGIALFPNQK